MEGCSNTTARGSANFIGGNGESVTADFKLTENSLVEETTAEQNTMAT